MKKISLVLVAFGLIFSGCFFEEKPPVENAIPPLSQNEMVGSGKAVENNNSVKVLDDFLLDTGILNNNSYSEWNKIKFIIPNNFEIYNQTEKQLTISNVSENEWQRVKEINEQILQEGGGREAENFHIGNLMTIRKINGSKIFDELIKEELLYTAIYKDSFLRPLFFVFW